ncbi:hypothetical protein [Rhodothermus bifroesti]|uniref:Uncharacterized protein n=1 Tax=Rhodothermus marinus TaxID=29549 RepID=A0A7V2B2D5_RHOMR|nr:hypothetical protein [Rhodothermus bifroesti]
MHRWLTALGLLVLQLPAWGQPVGSVATSFLRDVSRYGWAATLTLQPRWGAWQLSWHQTFTSDAYELGQGRLDFRDESTASWLLTASQPRRLQPLLSGRLFWFNAGRVLTQQILAGLRYQPNAGFWLEPTLGLGLDQRPGTPQGTTQAPLRTDYGPALGMRLQLMPPAQWPVQMRLEAGVLEQQLTPRQRTTAYLSGMLQHQSDALNFDVQLRAARLRRDTYQAVSFLNRNNPSSSSESVEATRNDTLWGSLNLELPLMPQLQFAAGFEGQSVIRQVWFFHTPPNALFFNTRFNRRQLNGTAALTYSRNPWMLHLMLETGAEEETRLLTNREHLPLAQAAQKATLLQQADYARGHLTLGGQGRLKTGRLTLGLRALSTILRHDTPEVNLDDRDELQQQARFELGWRLTSTLEAEIGLEATYYHLVYLKSARSAENYVQRTLRLEPGLRFAPSTRTLLHLQSHVRAAYTVADFVLPGRQRQDQSARELGYRLEMQYALTSILHLHLQGSYSELRLGRLLWGRFAEIPFDTLRTYTAWLRLESRNPELTSSIGFRLFLRQDYATSLLVAYLTETGTQALVNRPGQLWIVQFGPTCALRWQAKQALQFTLEGWLLLQRVHRRLYGPLPSATADRIRKAAWNGERGRFPNLTFSLTWQL